MSLFFILFLATLRVCGQAETNALPKLAPPYGPMPPTFWEQDGPAVIAGGVALVIIAGLIVWWLWRPKPPADISPETQAREALTHWAGRPEDGNTLSNISQILRRHVACAFEFPAAEFTTTEFCRELARNEKISPELAQAISSLLRECDERKFSPPGSPAPLQAASRALELVELAEKLKAGSTICPAQK